MHLCISYLTNNNKYNCALLQKFLPAETNGPPEGTI